MQKKDDIHSWGIVLSGLLYVLGAASLVIVNEWEIIHSVLMILLMAIYLLHKVLFKGGAKRLAYAAIIAAFSEVILLVNYHYYLLCVNAFASIIIGGLLVGFQLKYRPKRKAVTNFRKALTISGLALGSVIIALTLLVMVAAVQPGIVIKLLFGETNSYQPKNEQKSTVLKDGTLYINDIRYGDKYPNSFLDIYIAENDLSAARPTYIFIHGGGFATGDKAEIDGEPSDFEYYTSFTEAGYNVISINYAFSPDYSYPTPLYQLSEAVAFLKEHANDYGLDMTKIFFGGSSAGGHIAGQFVNIQVNSEYAEKADIHPVVDADSIKGVIFNSALFEPTRFDESSDSFYKDYMWSIFARAYWGNDFETNEAAKRSSIINHVTRDYPPVYISDGNTASFYKQAKLFDQELTELGIEHVFNFYEKDTAALEHGYEMILSNKYSQENMELMLGFIESQLK